MHRNIWIFFKKSQRFARTINKSDRKENVSQIKNTAFSTYINISDHIAHHPILVNWDDDESYLEIKKSNRGMARY
ncbi:hypothetical protein GQ41_3230 [Arenibacter algicola]|uniref:Uncharacterized protein n=1 Tax=Arenibacter algicola TaxID=616991 RepID=A0ABY3AIV4_9FLAO